MRAGRKSFCTSMMIKPSVLQRHKNKDGEWSSRERKRRNKQARETDLEKESHAAEAGVNCVASIDTAQKSALVSRDIVFPAHTANFFYPNETHRASLTGLYS